MKLAVDIASSLTNAIIWHVHTPKYTCAQVEILRALRCQKIIEVYQFYQKEKDYYYVVMEYMQGGEVLLSLMHTCESCAKIPVDGYTYPHC